VFSLPNNAIYFPLSFPFFQDVDSDAAQTLVKELYVNIGGGYIVAEAGGSQYSGTISFKFYGQYFTLA